MRDDRQYPAGPLVRWFWRDYVRKTWLVLLAGGFFMAIEGASLGALSYMVRPMFDDVFVAADRSAIYWVAGIVFFLFVGRAIAGMLQRILMAIAARTVEVAMQTDLVAHIVRLDSMFFHEHGPGTLMERVRGDTAAVVGIISQTFSALGRDVIALISLIAVALSIDWIWTLVALAGAPLILAPVVVLQRLIRTLSRTSRILAGQTTNRLDETFHGMDTIKLNGTEEAEAKRFASLAARQARVTVKVGAAQAGIPALMDIVAAIGFFGVLTYGGIQIIEGHKTVGDFMSFFTAIALLFEPMRRLGGLSGAWQRALVSLERVRAVFDETPHITSPAQPQPFAQPAGERDVVFQDVTFGYDETPVIRSMSFTAKAGKTTALVGASGAGKTTVFKLLARLVDPQSGTVRMGSNDISQLALDELRGTISTVTQDTQLFDETILHNITLGKAFAEDDLQAALTAAHVADFLPSLSDGLHTRAGPRGSNLSGGQRQRVAIARALLRNTPILMLDEATSALDTKSEKIVQSALDALATGRTTLVIAHRLSTIQNADQIIVMDQGRVVETGRHNDLLARGGLYASLHQLQFSGEPDL